MNDVLKTIENRRSIRRFKDSPVEDETIELLLHAGVMAPSAGNLQARDFIVVRDKSVIEELGVAAWRQSQVRSAPVVLVVCANYPRSAAKYGERSELYAVQDATASVMNILLAAHSLGLGACWVGAFDEGSVSEIMALPEDVRPMALIPVGYPDESPSAPPRLSLDSVVHRDRW